MKRLPFILIGIFLILTAVAIFYRGAAVSVGASVGHADLSFLFAVAFFSFMVLGFFIWLAALIHMLRNTSIQGTEKIVWALVIIFLNLLGAIVYFLIAPRSKVRIPLPRRGF